MDVGSEEVVDCFFGLGCNFLFATSQAQAAQIYQSTVINATNAGYVARAGAYPFSAVQAWQGDHGLSFKSVAYYQDPNVGDAWTVDMQYA